jgi:hypothetical protein
MSRFDGQRPGQIDAQVDLETAPHDGTRARRHRDIAPAQRQIAEVVSQKVLHGWLQNRHQTVIPLNINIGRLPASEAEAVVRFAAVAALAGGAPGAPERVGDWLAAAGAAPDLLAAYTAALGVPPALNASLSDVTRSDLALIVFVLALVAARDAGPAARAFADYIALHCALPTSTVRAAVRRYRV